jgi:protoporphyrinogen/coproporphyrinogen III oxidase
MGGRFVVVGGGIAGLAAALRLRERAGESAQIVLVEGGRRLGGKLRTARVAGVACEAGAEMFLVRERGADSAVLALAQRVGLAAEVVHPAPVPAAVLVDETLHELPRATLLGIPSDLSTVEPVAVVPGGLDADRGSAVLAPGTDVAVGSLVRDRFGDDVVDHLVDPLLGGVYAGRADDLSLQATMPGLYEAASQHSTLAAAVRAALAAAPRPAGQPVFATIHGGLSRLVAAVAAASGAQLRLGSPVRQLSRTRSGMEVTVGGPRPSPETLSADAVVLALPSRPLARLLAGVDAEAAALLAALDYASVGLVTLALPSATMLPALSGFLVPADQGHAMKAVTFVTTKWPHLHRDKGPVLVRASFGRYRDSDVLQLTDDELVGLAVREFGAILDTTLPELIGASVSRWGGSLPQYGVGHVPRVAQARAALPATLALAGAGFDGVGIAACVRSGEAAADAVWAATV